jgi:hypothetical protein
MKKQWDRFEYRLFRENNTISIRKIYYSEDAPHAYSNPIALQSDDFVSLWELLRLSIDAFCRPVIDQSYFKNE